MIPSVIWTAGEATWPAAEYAVAGGFRIGRGKGGGGRISSARPIGDRTGADIDAAVAIQRGWGEPAQMLVDDDDAALSAALLARGWISAKPTVVMEGPIAPLTEPEIPPVTAFALWPPLAIQRSLWTDQQIGQPRQDAMERVQRPKAALLGRMDDRAGGAGFVAVDRDVAMLHALAVLPQMRGGGLGRFMILAAARFAAAQGARRLALCVTRENPARRLYDRLGLTEAGGYSYWTPGA